MKRETKFRAWDERNNRMIIFDRMEFRSEYNCLEFGCNWAKYGFGYGDLGLEDNAPVMQYTGIEDKNGKEICEGDIVRGIFDVDKVENWLWLGLTKKEKRTGEKLFKIEIPEVYQNSLPEDIEIIGNIYSNPKLLK